MVKGEIEMIFEIPKDTEVLQIDITELKKQIRSDTIDDFANWLVEQGILGNRCISEGEITDYGKVYAKKYKEQIKENK